MVKHLSVLMPYGAAIHTDPWRAQAFDWIQRRYEHLLPDAELILGSSDREPFNRSQARNNAFTQAAGDVLLVADADIVFHPRQILRGLAKLEHGAPWVICYGQDRYYNLSRWATETALRFEPDATLGEPIDSSYWDLKLTSWAGLLLVPRAAWETVGGYDEGFIGWGFEDNEFQRTMDLTVGRHERVDSYVLHLWHERGDADFDHPHIDHNRARLDEGART